MLEWILLSISEATKNIESIRTLKQFCEKGARYLAQKNDWFSEVKNFFLFFILFYRKNYSYLAKGVCIYQPTCSHYSYEAIQRYGAFRGGYLGIRRILRCRPPFYGGFDPVPSLKD